MDKDPDGIDSLQNKLYSRTKAPKPRARRSLRPDTHQVEESWEKVHEVEEKKEFSRPKPKKPPTPIKEKQSRTRSVLTITLASSFVFFIGALAFSVYTFLFTEGPSPENIDIEISGPLTIPGGEELGLQIQIVNRNPVAIELADLIIDYPDGTRSAADLNIDLSRYREAVGTIEPGEQKRLTARSVLFGEEESQKKINLVLEYRIEGSNSIFFKDKTYNVLLSSAPVSLIVDSVKEISSGQEVLLTARVVSNSSGILEDVLVTADYPFGFTFGGAKPEPVAGNSVWNLGDMEPGSEREIEVRGLLTGQDTEERIFRFRTGVQDPRSDTEIAAVFNTSEIPIMIKRPFMQVGIALNGQEGSNSVTVAANSLVNGIVEWENTLPTTLYDVEVTAKFSGPALDRARISSRDGFYRSQDVSVIWNEETTDGVLGSIEPGDRGKLAFAFAPLPVTPAITITDPNMTVEVTVRGRRVSESEVPEAIETSAKRTAIVASNIALASRTLYRSGPYNNTGPIPPRAESPTTYTLELSVANSTSDLENVVLTTRVPWYLEWFDQITPTDANVTYNPVSGDLTWTIGDVPAGVGYTQDPIQLYLQVGLEPSLSQVGNPVELLYGQSIRGVDSFTGTVLTASEPALTTVLSSDPAVDRRQSSGDVTQ